MNPQKSLLFSKYVIDGVPQEFTPAQMLLGSGPGTGKTYETIMDESVDPKIGTTSFDVWKIKEYLSVLSAGTDSGMDLAFAGQYAKILVCKALIDSIWKDGHFRLGDLRIGARWKWNSELLGSSAAFYASCLAATEYANDLGVAIREISVKDSPSCSLEVDSSLDPDAGDSFADDSVHAIGPSLSDSLCVGSTLVPDPDSWIVYIPFENCSFGLGGSSLCRRFGECRDLAPELGDPDYFIDCYEVVREMVEDGVFKSGCTVCEGGLALSLQRLMGGGGTGISISLRPLLKAYGEADSVRAMFSEVPGVIVQVSDNDFDYIDAEFTLQDVAFYPLGHPLPSRPGLKVDISDKGTIGNILDSLIRSQSSEGED